MALIHADGYGHYGSAQYNDIYSDGAFGAAVSIGAFGPNGRRGLRFTGDFSDSVERLSLTTSGAVCIMQGDFQVSESPSEVNVILAPLLSGSIQCSLDLHTDRTLRVYRGFAGTKTLLASSTYVVPLDTHIHVGAKFTIDNTTGSIVVHVWESGDTAAQVVISVTGVDTQDGGSATWDGFNKGAACDGTTDWSNFIVMDGSGSALNDLLGPKDCHTLFASDRVASALTDWSLSSGSSIAALLDDETPDDDSSYVEESTQDDEVSTAVDPVPYPGRAIVGAQLYASARETSGSATVKALARQDSTTYLGSDVALGASYAYVMQPYSAMPDGTAFSGVTAATFDALQWGLALTSASTTARLTQIAVVVIQDRTRGGSRNLLTGRRHRYSCDDGFIAGQENRAIGGAPEAHGVAGTIIGHRSVLFNQDGTERTETGDGRFIVHAKQIDLNANTVKVNGSTLSTGSDRGVGITIDGGGNTITTGVKGYVQVPFSGTITKATLLSTVSGSIVVDVWKDTFANFPPTDADSITASAPPTLSMDDESEDSTLTGWTTTIAAGDILAFNVDSATSVTRVTLILTVQP